MEIPFQQFILHGIGQSFYLAHGLKGVFLFVIADLILDNIGRNMDLSCVAQQKIVLQFVDNILFYPQRIHHHIVPSVELNKIKPSEGGRVLVLITAVNL